ncbi:MAG: condensation domain-containing protein [Acidobacteria bacterium]|nr:condensation domain-containing protein [Acidobacteriota bacterium]
MSRNNIEDIYPLSPAQEGILFHSLSAAESGIYISQNSCTLRHLNVTMFERAWRSVIDRHPILRTAFVWTGLAKPHQVVGCKVAPHLAIEDWRGFSSIEQLTRFEVFAQADRRQGFIPSRAPLMRLTLLRLADNRYRFIWSHHHLLLDGWSVFMILKEVADFYQSGVKGHDLNLKSARPFSDYIGWLQQQDSSRAEMFWRRILNGFTQPVKLGMSESNAEEQGQKIGQSIKLLPATLDRLHVLARSHHLTLNTLIQGAWALIISHISRRKDLVFGTTVSGRPVSLAGVEAMAGLFINVLPMRVQVVPGAQLLPWLKGIQEQRIDAGQYEHVPLSQIQRWSDVPRGQALFESLLSFENYPIQIDDAMLQLGRDLEAQDFRWDSESNFPLTIIASPRNGLSLKIVYAADQFTANTISRLLSYYVTLLDRIAASPEVRLGELEGLLTKADRKQQVSAQRAPLLKGLNRPGRNGTVNLSLMELVKTGFLRLEQPLPLVVQPAVKDVELADWVKNQRDWVETELLEHGAILFRGFGIKSPSEFEQVAAAICLHLFSEYGDLPRDEVSGKVYSSTPYPADKAILFHNESSHLHQWPMKIWFHCVKAAQEGGETPIVDCRRVYQSLDLHIREQFLQKKIMYVRNFTDGMDVSWQTFFRTDQRCEVENYCRAHEIDFEWKKGNRLQTRQICRAVVRHPKTKDAVFFNQVQLHHPSCLDESLRQSMFSLFGEDDLPRNVYYGDGTIIEESVMREIGQIYRASAINFPWQEGDILMLDNMLTAHGRNPYGGHRKIIVTMGEMLNSKDLEN